MHAIIDADPKMSGKAIRFADSAGCSNAQQAEGLQHPHSNGTAASMAYRRLRKSSTSTVKMTASA